MTRALPFTALFLIACSTQKAPPASPEPAPQVAPPSTPEHVHDHGNAWTLDGMAEGAVLLKDLGAFHRKVGANDEAQVYFDQGLALAYGFNHDESARSFARAAQLDPQCGMCFWGVALTLGPNYNIPMLPERAQAAWEALSRARELAPQAPPVERALIEALAKRYKGPQYVDPGAMQAYNEAYAAAMRDVAKQFPADVDVQVLFAEAAMNVNPWKLWSPQGEPAPGTLEIVQTLEAVLAKVPDHVGANHYYIHAVEASKEPGRAIPSADRLGSLLPGAGHVVHMPAHIYQRVGRYADASAANRGAIEADLKYLEAVKPPGYYPFYISHNYGFLAYSAAMEGRSREALAAARKSSTQIPKDVVCSMPGMDFFWSEPLLVMTRFGLWEDILAEQMPDPKYPSLLALWHHAHGMALASTGEPQDAKKDLAAIVEIAGQLPEELMTGLNQGKRVLELAAKVLEARIASVEKDPRAIELWEAAVTLEDGLAYNEPADWFYPVRHHLGVVLLEAGRAKEAEAVYRADLERNPQNGWALFGVWKALEAQKKGKKVKAAEDEFRKAWSRADLELTASAF